jgi:hypothetical protein
MLHQRAKLDAAIAVNHVKQLEDAADTRAANHNWAPQAARNYTGYLALAHAADTLGHRAAR